MKRNRIFSIILAGALSFSLISSGCAGGSGETSSDAQNEVVIYSNADDEAIEAMKAALDAGGYDGKYIFQTFGTSELGGKVFAEGSDIEADLITLSTFYIDSAQEQKNMFQNLNFEYKLLDGSEKTYCAPITSQEGAIIINTEMLSENGLPTPASLKDLTNPIYKDMISVTDIQSSSTAWLLIQALVSEYGEEGAKEVLTAIYENAGPHIESSGSAPLKKVRAGEVAVGFGLRQQAVADKESGLPIDYVDPTEGNFSLTESVAVVDKGDKTNPLAQEMAKCIIENGRSELQKYYPNSIYEGEKTDSVNASLYPKTFPEPLTVELLKKHQELSESCK
ncbi:extracellular solute-binding protein [Anaerotignum faecicola]|nr:extracellular solute-binding protein [Anaerotignum faecicola]